MAGRQAARLAARTLPCARSSPHTFPRDGGSMIHIPDHHINRIRDNLPTTQEIAAHVLLFGIIWGGLVLIVLEALP
ncbi:hypothetical protein AA11826_1804 [Komagataeibacter oboediens DSM 11826]|nr:hypothetical protein AA11826_1804 [Komagataeibacter oboediens DSM 11826]